LHPKSANRQKSSDNPQMDYQMLNPPRPDSTKSSRKEGSDKPDLIIDGGNLPAAVCDLRDLFAQSGDVFERGVPVQIVLAPTAVRPSRFG
jgi:hypothetical protein